MAHEIRLAQVQPPMFASVVTQIVFRYTLYYNHNFMRRTHTDNSRVHIWNIIHHFNGARGFAGKCAHHSFNIIE